jgi:HPt (histidine-containing phosphotransfer) domain-containing protein
LSDEFLRIAKKEVTDDIAGIGNLLRNCTGDSDVFKNAPEIEKHVHKLKGLAPMMGHDQIGQIAALIDSLLKTAIAGKEIPGIYMTVTKSHEFMQNAINGTKADFSVLKTEIEKNHGAFIH